MKSDRFQIYQAGCFTACSCIAWLALQLLHVVKHCENSRWAEEIGRQAEHGKPCPCGSAFWEPCTVLSVLSIWAALSVS